ncbi:MAG: helix-turn-helix domain-containing protein [Coriobacteriia bacterium]|nr:helix-turn-helix domain-containing protein [Coriobacteriia bacterium]
MGCISNIGRDLVAARRELGITQRELGERVGVAQPQIARWEANAYRSASLDRVADVADALDRQPRDAVPCDAEDRYRQQTILAAESTSPYVATRITVSDDAAPAVRGLGEIAHRLRAHGQELHDVYGLESLGVFGSFASGMQTPDSDVDILVETAETSGFRFVSAAGRIEEILGRKVDFVRPHLLRDRLRERVLDEVVYVWSA